MTWWSKARAVLVRWGQMLAPGIRRVLAAVIQGQQDAYLLRPRCCHDEQFREDR